LSVQASGGGPPAPTRAAPTRTGRSWTLLGADRRPYQSLVPGTLGGHRRSRIYGRLDCPGAARAIARGGYVANRVFFLDEPAAIAAGYRPCWECQRDAYRRWKTTPGAT
jgi:hypothetical protein